MVQARRYVIQNRELAHRCIVAAQHMMHLGLEEAHVIFVIAASNGGAVGLPPIVQRKRAVLTNVGIIEIHHNERHACKKRSAVQIAVEFVGFHVL
ncbi:MAG TPA: hypothetical protein PK198_25810 [Saprospiraceae bacterium]|nr:hypothetical protein [Saprospiraceae bacterium]